MSSSNWRQPTAEEDWESCGSETTNKTTTPPPKYSSLQMVDNAGTGSNDALRREILQEQREIDVENGLTQPVVPPSSWYEEICNRISVKKHYNRIPFKQILDCITPENIFKFFGTLLLCFAGLTAIVVGAVLAWDLIVYVVVNRTKSCNKSA